MRSIFLFVALLFCASTLFAQGTQVRVKATDPLGSLKEKQMQGVLTIGMDSLIEANYNKHLVQNSKQRGVKGYRIRIYSNIGQGAKDNQRRVKASFLSLYPDIPTYDRYEGSYFKIYVGDFRTKRDALLVLDRIDRKFPDAFIVEDNIIINE